MVLPDQHTVVQMLPRTPGPLSFSELWGFSLFAYLPGLGLCWVVGVTPNVQAPLGAK